MFEDRRDAGRRLGRALVRYKGAGVLVLAIPRGGVEVGREVALALDAEFSVIVSRKLPRPDNPETGFGAVAEDGSLFLIGGEVGLPRETVDLIIRRQKAEVRRRIESFRAGTPLPAIRGRTVIIVDDGIAMGSTMRVSIDLCRNRGAGKIVVAAPVGGPEALREFSRVADDVVILEQPRWFRAVAEAYRHWYDVSDEEVVAVLKEGR